MTHPVPSVHPDLEREQAYIVSAYEALAAMQGRTAVVLEAAIDDARRGDTDADAAAMHLGRRLSRARRRGLALWLRAHRRGGAASEGHGDFYVGRRHVEDARRATRRHGLAGAGLGAVLPGHDRPTRSASTGAGAFATEGPTASRHSSTRTSTTPIGMPPSGRGGVARPAARRARTGPHREMRDIVATIQGEQDVVIRGAARRRASSCRAVPAPARPRSGLHRAAFLLYEHRGCSTRSACSSSGRTRCSSATSARSCRRSARPRPAGDGGRVAWASPRRRGRRTAAGAALGDARMATVVRAAVRGSTAAPEGDIDLPTAGGCCASSRGRRRRALDGRRGRWRRRTASVATRSCGRSCCGWPGSKARGQARATGS